MKTETTKIKVPLLDINRQIKGIRKEIDSAIAGVIDGAKFILGPEVSQFEKNMAEYCGVKYAVGCASGSDAILLALHAVGVKPGDTVITTAYSFYATAGTIWRLGAQPVFIDIDPDTYNMDTKQLADAICSNTSAILPVHLFGQTCNMTDIGEIAGDIPVIEDSAQAIGAKWQEIPTGQLGVAACFSFFPSKNLGGFGDGGMIVTNSAEIAGRCRSLRVHGAQKPYHHQEVGYNSRLDTIQAAILNVKLEYLDEWNLKRRENAAYYDRAFANTEVITPVILKNAESIYNQYSIKVKNRDGLKEVLRNRGIGHAVYYPLPLPYQACFSSLGLCFGNYPMAENAAAHSVSIPIFPELTRNEMDLVIESVLEAVTS